MPGWTDWIPQVITIGVFIYFFRDLKTDIRDLHDKVFDLGTRVSRVEGLLEARSEQKDDRHS
ncbi:MAG: hypothetical protein F4Z29_09595 [Gemmatimonadetes bacterium]|nr:hypothetical protein [Gemmatimonadota bacterium]